MALYVVDDHPLMREAIAMLARRVKPGLLVVEVGSLADLEAALAAHEAPECFCVDLVLPDAKGPEAVRHIKARCPTAKIAVLSAMSAAEAGNACRDAGADAFIEKTLGALALQAALVALLADAKNADAPGSPDAAGPTPLSRRQQELLVLLDEGLSNRDIAARLEISEHTVKVHLWRLFKRLGVRSRTQSLYVARRNGLI